eukprot:CFRG4076T1
MTANGKWINENMEYQMAMDGETQEKDSCRGVCSKSVSGKRKPPDTVCLCSTPALLCTASGIIVQRKEGEWS